MCRSGQRGIGLATAIFLLLVIGGLIVFLVRLSGLQHSAAALDVQGARAYQSARAGIEWGVYRALRDNSCAGSSSFGLSADLSDFTVTVVCVDTPYTEVDAVAKHVYQIVATACNRPVAGACPGSTGPYYVERQLQALVDKAN
ncbi:MAG: agglutinin biogenesis protein MshP [Burkholderiales bacterium]|jgi:MSHA biogenesis protein MshP